MSNPLAIAAVSNTLRTLIDRGLRDGTTVTILPPDLARANVTGNQINIFLYQVALSPAWRNMDMPGRTQQGETAMPPLALNLYYLLTVFAGDNNDDLSSQSLLGRAMSLLHDHPLLGRVEIQAALPGNDLYAQIERIRLSVQPLTLDDIFKLWSGYQTPYRLSVAYEAAVVLIDSALASTTPLPVLTFGPDDTGPTAQADLIPPYSSLDPNLMSPRTDVVAGATLTLGGHHLQRPGDTAAVHFRGTIPPDPPDVPVKPGGTEQQVQVVVPATLSAGFYTVAAVISQPRAGDPTARDERVTNELPFALSPQITGIGPTGGIATTTFTAPVQVKPNAQGVVDLTLTVRPNVGLAQRPALLFGDLEVRAQPITGTSPTGQLRFLVNNPAPRRYRVRLRVDGVDSPLIDWSKTPPVFLAPVIEVTS
ncbi:MAG: DUF4255 domain-containing protein [Candidatus Limnocylindrales bacterium]